jgi:hypothetical protein
MLEWKVRYYNNSLPLVEVTSDEMEWNELVVDGVIEVDVINGRYMHTLSGMDYYWISGSRYGMFNETGSIAEIEANIRLNNGHEQVYYSSGSNARMLDWENEHIDMGDIFPDKDTTHILKGVMITDDEAREIGLI